VASSAAQGIAQASHDFWPARASSTRRFGARAAWALAAFWARVASLRRGRGVDAICAARGAARAAVGISKIDFLGDRRALRRAFCSRGRRAGPAKAKRERNDAAARRNR